MKGWRETELISKCKKILMMELGSGYTVFTIKFFQLCSVFENSQTYQSGENTRNSLCFLISFGGGEEHHEGPTVCVMMIPHCPTFISLVSGRSSS